MRKRILSLLLTLSMVIILFPTVVFATEGTYGAFTITGDDLSGVSYSGEILTIGANGSYTIVQTPETATATTDRIAISAGITVNIRLSGVNINSAVNYHAFDIASTASVNLIINGINTINAVRAAGIHVPIGAILTIDKASTGTNESCVLNVAGNQWGAAIGGGCGEAAGSITINGATVNATGNSVKTGASIGGGGGNWMGYGANGGTLTINGGIVNASGTIGGGANNYDSHSSGGAITITGGSVIADRIGNRDNGSHPEMTVAESATNYVKITGGTVKCTNAINPAPRNDVPVSGALVFKTTLIFNDGEGTVNNAAVASLTLTSGTYGIWDMQTDTNGELYIYLPEGKTVTAVTVGDDFYTGSVTTNTGGTASGYFSKAVSTPPEADKVEIFKTDETQDSVVFTLTTAPSGAYKVYADNFTTTVHETVTAMLSEMSLTLTDSTTDIPAGEYYISVTEIGKSESTRLKLTVDNKPLCAHEGFESLELNKSYKGAVSMGSINSGWNTTGLITDETEFMNPNTNGTKIAKMTQKTLTYDSNTGVDIINFTLTGDTLKNSSGFEFWLAGDDSAYGNTWIQYAIPNLLSSGKNETYLTKSVTSVRNTGRLFSVNWGEQDPDGMKWYHSGQTSYKYEVPSAEQVKSAASVKISIFTSFTKDTAPQVFYVDDISTLSNEIIPPKYSVTLDGVSQSFDEGGKYTFPALSVSGLAYTDGTQLFEAGDEVTVNSDLVFTTVDLQLSMHPGAAMRYEIVSGLRYLTNINGNTLEMLKSAGAEITIGTLIAPRDLLGAQSELTLNFENAARKADGKASYLNVLFESNELFSENTFAGSIANIFDHNANREFVGRGYATVTINGVTKTVYAEFSGDDIGSNSRKIAWVAQQIKLGTEYETLGAYAKGVVDKYQKLFIQE